MPNRRDVLEAAKTIKEFCINSTPEECVNCPLGKGNSCQAGTVSPIEWDLPDYIWIPKPLGPIARERKKEKVESTRNREGCAGKAVRSGGGA